MEWGEDMEDKLIIIDDLSKFASKTYKTKNSVKEHIFTMFIYSFMFYVMRLIFIIPIFIFSSGNISLFKIYNTRYTYKGPSYDEIWTNFNKAFLNVFQNKEYLIKYMIVSFIILSILFIVMTRSPIGILISFFIIVISPYVVYNIFLPVISFLYVPLNFICLFIDNCLPERIPIIELWGMFGFLFGLIKIIRKGNNKVIITFLIMIIVCFVVTNYKFSIQNAYPLNTFFKLS